LEKVDEALAGKAESRRELVANFMDGSIPPKFVAANQQPRPNRRLGTLPSRDENFGSVLLAKSSFLHGPRIIARTLYPRRAAPNAPWFATGTVNAYSKKYQ
jgi:hypothetical protein